MEIVPVSVAIIWPTIALVALIFAVWLTLAVSRFGHLRRNPPRPGDFETGEAALRYFQPVERPMRNLANLFEMPVLYFALVPLLLVMRQVDMVQVVLAWAYVALRTLHSIIHIRTHDARPRFLVYLASCIVLSAMWIGFAVDMAAVAHAVSAAS